LTSEPEFATDLYRGTAPYYDRYRPPYPQALFEDLVGRLPVSGHGRLLDLACGTGQIALPLAPSFVEVVAVDQEAEAIAFGQAKAAGAAAGNIHWVAGSAETVELRGRFELVTVGNAFHRLRRQVVSDRLASWLQPGGGVALIWADTPPQGDQPWQLALQELFVQWMARAGTAHRVPATWESAIRDDPHELVLQRAGLEYTGKFEFTTHLEWTVESLIGFAYSTSMLNRAALGANSEEFERDLTGRLGPLSEDGTFRCTVSCSYELARR